MDYYRFELKQHMDSSREFDAAIAEATEENEGILPVLEQPNTAGGAQIDVELRANFRVLPEQQQAALLKSSKATRMALARSPIESTPD